MPVKLLARPHDVGPSQQRVADADAGALVHLPAEADADFRRDREAVLRMRPDVRRRSEEAARQRLDVGARLANEEGVAAHPDVLLVDAERDLGRAHDEEAPAPALRPHAKLRSPEAVAALE